MYIAMQDRSAYTQIVPLRTFNLRCHIRHHGRHVHTTQGACIVIR